MIRDAGGSAVGAGVVGDETGAAGLAAGDALGCGAGFVCGG
ncbi:MAG TPA: hypothetical protein VE821_04985 [Pyrinomonadaceae bacterium]|nr:hypothetical protein [Pyrinomonadaceae bacterium]